MQQDQIQLPSEAEWLAMSPRERGLRVLEITGNREALEFEKMQEQPLISIIVTARNYGHFLRDCLLSCKAQHYQRTEVIYSDDGSTDDSVAIARSIQGVKVVACPRHSGAVEARNRGFRASRGEILIFLDADDQIRPDYIGEKLAVLRDGHSFAYGNIQSFGGRAGYQVPPAWTSYAELLKGNFCESASAIWRHIFEEAGGWQETPDSTLWDWHLWLRAARIAAPVKSNSVVLYRVHDKSNSQTVGFAKPGIDAAAVLDRVRSQFTAGGKRWRPPKKDRPLRVGFVQQAIHMGGATQWLASLLEHGTAGGKIEWSGIALTRQDRQEIGFTDPASHPCGIAALAQKTMIAAGAAVSNPSLVNLPTPRDAVQFIAAESDVLVAWCREPLEGLLSDFTGPVVLLSHGSCPWTEELIRGQQDRATHFAAVSKAAAGVFRGGVKVQVLHNGAEPGRCEPKRTRAAVRKEWGVKPKEIAVAHIGRFSWDKNPLAVANAVAELGKPYRAVFVGNGWREREVKEAIETVVDGAIFAPECDQVGDALAAADCFVLATPHEGFSLSLIEAWLAGVPVVATRVGAVPEIEKKFGPLIIPVSVRPSPQEMAAAVKLAVSKRNKIRIAKAQKIAREHFTAQAMGERWARYLLEISRRAD